MSSEGVAFLVVLAAVGAVPASAAFAAWRASKRNEARLNEVLALLRVRQLKARVGFKLPTPPSAARDEAS